MTDTQRDNPAAYRAAVAHPYFVDLYADWSPNRTTVGFQTETEARRFASLRPEPLIDLVRRSHGVIAARRLVAHPAADTFVPRDDFPDTRS